jgi:alpha-glucosidase
MKMKTESAFDAGHALPGKRHDVIAGQNRRSFLSSAIAVPVFVAGLRLATKPTGLVVKSPDGLIEFQLQHAGILRFQVTFNRQIVISESELTMVVDGVNLSRDVVLRSVSRDRRSGSYVTRGVHSVARDQCNGLKITFEHEPDHTIYVLEVRVFDDGVAFRHLIPGSGSRVPDEASSFTVPTGSIVWFHDFEGHYEGIHQKKEIESVKAGEWVAPPLTIKLPNSSGYMAITEAALVNYAGMGLQANGKRGFTTRLGHALPISHPFDLRYGKDEAQRLSKAAAVEGPIATPWRVLMIARNLNDLVNSDIINNVSPPADKVLFPAGTNTSWIRPGRAVWRYLDGGENTFDEIKEFSRLAGELGFEYQVVEGFWRRWPEGQMRELIEFSRQKKVGIWFWKHSKDLRTPHDREEFFSLCNRVGVVGAKIDFFDHEAKEVIDLYQALLRTAAEHQVMLEFHGANKPAGEARTWPNEMTREAVRGLEYRSMQTRARHNTTLPFTRYLAGHADYTPMHFGERRRETSWSHQIASAIIFTSPLLIFGAHPKNILQNPAVELIKKISSVWDETIVLPESEIGELAIFARRSGRMWMLAMMNGEVERSIRVRLLFLGRGSYQAKLALDRKDDPAALLMKDSAVSRSDSLTIEMRAGGGFVGMFTR